MSKRSLVKSKQSYTHRHFFTSQYQADQRIVKFKAVFSEQDQEAYNEATDGLRIKRDPLPLEASHASSVLPVWHEQRKLLNLIYRAPPDQQYIPVNQNDVKYIMRSVHYSGYDPSASPSRIKRRAFKFLYYLVKDYAGLELDYIVVLLKELLEISKNTEYMELKAKNYLALILACLIVNGAELPVIKGLDINAELVKLLQSFYEVGFEYMSTILVLLKALAHRGYQFSENDLCYLLKIIDVQQPMCVLTNSVETQFEKLNSFKTRFWIYKLQEFKKMSQRGERLSFEAVEYTIKDWENNSDIRQQAKAAAIIYHQSQYVQKNFPQKLTLANCLIRELTSPETKTRDRTIISAQNLLRDEEFPKRDELSVKINAALLEHRTMVLDLLTRYIFEHRKQVNVLLFEHVLGSLMVNCNEQYELVKKAQYLKDFLCCDFDAQIIGLQDKSRSIHLTKLFLDLAGSDVDISKAISHLSSLIKTEDYPLKARINALLALTCYLKKQEGVDIHRPILGSLADYIISCIFHSDNSELINASLKMLACIINIFEGKNIADILCGIRHIFSERACQRNSIFLFSKVIRKIYPDEESEIQAQRIAQEMLLCVMGEYGNYEDQESVLKLAHLLINQVKHIDALWTRYLLQVLRQIDNEGSKEGGSEKIDDQVALILSCLNQVLSQEKAIFLEQTELHYLVQRIPYISSAAQYTVIRILVKNMDNADDPYDMNLLSQVSDQLKNIELVGIICHLLKNQISKKGSLSCSTLDNISRLFTVDDPEYESGGNQDYEYTASVLLIEYVNPVTVVSQNFIDNLVSNLSTMDDGIYVNVLIILSRVAHHKYLDFSSILQECTVKFEYGLSSNVRSQFAVLLSELTGKEVESSIDTLKKLTQNLFLFDDNNINLAVSFLNAQLRYHLEQGFIASSIDDYDALFSQFLKFMTNHLQDLSVENIKQGLSFIRALYEQNYIPPGIDELLVQLKNLLYQCEDRLLRMQVLEFFEQYLLPESVQAAFALDRISFTVDECSALIYIRDHVSYITPLTLNNYDFLSNIISSGDSELVGIVFRLYEKTRHYKLATPLSFIEQLIKYLTTTLYVPSGSSVVSMLICDAMDKQILLPHPNLLFSLVESEFLHNTITLHQMKALHYVALQGFRLNSNTLTLLKNRLGQSEEFVDIIADVLALAVKNKWLIGDELSSLLQQIAALHISVKRIRPLIDVLLVSSDISHSVKNILSMLIQPLSDELEVAVDVDQIVMEENTSLSIPIPNWIKNIFITQSDTHCMGIINMIGQLGWDEHQTRSLFLKIHLRSYQEIIGFLSYLITTELNSSKNFLLKIFSENTAKSYFDVKTLYCDMLHTHAKLFFENNELMCDAIVNLYNIRHWPAEILYHLMIQFKRHELGVTRIHQILDIALSYPDIEYREFFEIVKTSEPDSIYQKICQLRLSTFVTFKEKKRSLDELLDKYPHSSVMSIKVSKTKKILKNTEVSSQFYVKYGNRNIQINKWEEKDVTAWANETMRAKYWSVHFLEDTLRIITYCFKKCFGYYLHNSQLLAIIALVNKPQEIGRILQVATGEGKSHIIAALAVIQRLQGQKVDIVTSSLLLAKRDAKIYQKFYGMFGFKVASNSDVGYTAGIKACYKKDIDIIYSDASEFQFDLLRTRFDRLGTRGDRVLECVIVDEVDNLLIDEKGKWAMLADEIPGMASVTPFLLKIWNRLLELKDGKNILDDTDEQALHEYVDDLIHKEEKTISAHLLAFVKKQKRIWVESACIAATRYQLGCQYEIKTRDGGRREIVPIDFSNTGVFQAGTLWENGLHQFLQIKHGIKVDSERLTSNFMSNLSFFREYKSNFYGITGTLGSEESQKFLGQVYQVDFVEIPTHKPKQFCELQGMLAESYLDWEEKILYRAQQEASLGRPVLIICEFKNFAEALYERLKAENSVVYKYCDNETDQGDNIERELQGGEIIVATNLAGRGTDLKISSQVERNGGLHVCLTFLPDNQRIEDQAFGRAARKGAPGTGQLILNKIDLKERFKDAKSSIDFNDFSVLKKERDALEKKELAEISRVELKNIETKDELFNRYLKLRDIFHQHDESEEGYFTKKMLSLGVSHSSLRSSVRNYILTQKLKSADEQWALWLATHDLNSKDIGEQFSTFERQLQSAYETDTIIENPHYYMNIAAYALSYMVSFAGRNLSILYQGYARIAAEMYTKALRLPNAHHTAFLSFYYRAYALLRLDGLENKRAAKEDFKEFIKYARLKLDDLRILNTLTCEMESAHDSDHNELPEHLHFEMKLYETLISSAEQNIKEIDRSQKLARVRIHKKDDIEEISKLDQDNVKEIIGVHRDERITLGFENVKNVKDWGSNEAATLFKSLSEDTQFGLHYRSSQLKVEGDIKRTLLNLLPINSWGRNAPAENTAKEEIPIEVAVPQEKLASERAIGLSANLKRAGQFIWRTGAESFYFVKKVAQSSENINRAARKVADACVSVKDKAGSLVDMFTDWKAAKSCAIKIEASLAIDFESDARLECWVDSYEDDYPNGTLILENLPPILAQKIKERFSSMSTLIRKKVVCFVQESISENHTLLQKKSIRDLIKAPDATSEFAEKALATLEIRDCNSHDLKNIIILLKENAHLEQVSSATTTPLESPQQQKDELLSRLSSLNNHDGHIKIQLKYCGITQELTQKLIQKSNVEEESLTLSFDLLSKKEACLMAAWNCDYSDNAFVECHRLNYADAIKAVDQVHRSEQGFSFKHQDMTEALSDMPRIKQWFPDYKINGFGYLYTLQEKSPMPWRGITFLLIAGIMQIGVGLLISTFTVGIGLNIGMALITEGVGDAFKAAASAYTRSFNMASYLATKAQSVFISAATLGFSAIKAAIAAARGIVTVETAATTATVAVGNAGRQVGRSVIGQVGSRAFDYVTSKGVGALEGEIRESIKLKVHSKLEAILHKKEIFSYLRRVFAYDQWFHTDRYRHVLFNEIAQIINQIGYDDYNLFEQKLMTYLENKFLNEWNFANTFLEYFKSNPVPGIQSENYQGLIALLIKDGVLRHDGIHVNYFSDARIGNKKYEVDSYDVSRLYFQDPISKQEKYFILEASLAYAKASAVCCSYVNECSKLLSFIGIKFLKKSEPWINLAGTTVNGLCSTATGFAVSAMSNAIKDQGPTLTPSAANNAPDADDLPDIDLPNADLPDITKPPIPQNSIDAINSAMPDTPPVESSSLLSEAIPDEKLTQMSGASSAKQKTGTSTKKQTQVHSSDQVSQENGKSKMSSRDLFKKKSHDVPKMPSCSVGSNLNRISITDARDITTIVATFLTATLDLSGRIYFQSRLDEIKRQYGTAIYKINKALSSIEADTRAKKNAALEFYCILSEILITYALKINFMCHLIHKNEDSAEHFDKQYQYYSEHKLKEDFCTLIEILDSAFEPQEMVENFFGAHAAILEAIIKGLIDTHQQFHKLKNQKKEAIMPNEKDDDKSQKNTGGDIVLRQPRDLDLVSSGVGRNQADMIVDLTGTAVTGAVGIVGKVFDLAQIFREAKTVEIQLQADLEKSKHGLEKERIAAAKECIALITKGAKALAESKGDIDKDRGANVVQLTQQLSDPKLDIERVKIIKEIIMHCFGLGAQKEHEKTFRVLATRLPAQDTRAASVSAAAAPMQAIAGSAQGEAVVADTLWPLDEEVLNNIAFLMQGEFGSSSEKPEFTLNLYQNQRVSTINIKLVNSVLEEDTGFKEQIANIVQGIEKSLKKHGVSAKYKSTGTVFQIQYQPKPNSKNLTESMFALFSREKYIEEQKLLQFNDDIPCAIQ